MIVRAQSARPAHSRLALPMALALAWATLGASAADASLGELSFLGCIGQVHLSECAAVPVGLEGAVEEPKGLAVSPDGANVYAADVNASAIDVFTRNALTGALTLTSCIGQHAGCATTTQAKAVERPFAVAVSPDGESVYAVSVGSNTVDEFSRDTMNGELTYTGCIGQLAGCTSTSPAEAISGPQSIAVSPDGTSVYVASENAGGAVDEFARNGSGTLKFESCIGAGGCAVPALHEALRSANAVAISPDGTDVYVGGQGASISTFARNTFTGGLAFKGCVGNFNECVQPSPLAVNEPTSLAVSPDGANLYAGNFANGVLDVFSRNTANGSLTFAGCDGALVSQPGACTEMPSENPAGALTVAVSPDGGDVYVSAEQGVYEYARGSGGALEFAGCTGIASGVCTATVPAEALSFSVSLALSPNGASLYAGAEIGKDLNVFGRQTVGCDDVSATVPYGTPTKLTLACTDTVGNALSFAIASPPGHGTLNAVEAGGQVTYTPAAGYSGPDGFTFSAHNADGTAAPASANITVEPAPGGASTQTPGPPAPNSSSSTPGIATTPRAVEELLLGCGKRALVLNDVLVRGDRVALEGSAAKGLVGKKVKILFDGSKQVATATVESDGQFSTTAPLPPAKLRNGSSARYMAESGGQRSLDLKLTRRLDLEPPRVSGHTVTLVGQVVPPLAKPLAPVVVQQELECGNTAAVKRATPSASGRFRITLTVPIAAKAGIYRLSSTVRDNTHSKRGFATYSLPLPAVLG